MSTQPLPELIFDASSLIAAARFGASQQLILDHILRHCLVIIPQEVKVEAVDDALPGGYSDALLLDQRVRSGSLSVLSGAPSHAVLEGVLNDYELEDGDKAVVRACRERANYDWAVVDDRLLYIVLNRFGLRPHFLPDVIEWLVVEGKWEVKLGEAASNAIRPRYRQGFVTHSLERIHGRL